MKITEYAGKALKLYTKAEWEIIDVMCEEIQKKHIVDIWWEPKCLLLQLSFAIYEIENGAGL